MRLLWLALLIPLLAEAGISDLLRSCGTAYRRMVGKTPQEKLELEVLREIQGSYFDLDRSSVAAVTKWNERLLRELNGLPLTGANRGRKPGLSTDEMEALYKKVADHPVASCSMVGKYDPGKNIGFCFGRAMAGHLEALRAGVAKEGIRKIWAVGTMHYEGIVWGHHVATMVRGADGKWWVIDPEYARPRELSEWMRKVKTMDKDGNLQFLSSEAKRFGPASDAPYTRADMTSEFYNKYFEDLLRASREEARSVREQRKASLTPSPAGSL